MAVPNAMLVLAWPRTLRPSQPRRPVVLSELVEHVEVLVEAPGRGLLRLDDLDFPVTTRRLLRPVHVDRGRGTGASWVAAYVGLLSYGFHVSWGRWKAADEALQAYKSPLEKDEKLVEQVDLPGGGYFR